MSRITESLYAAAGAPQSHVSTKKQSVHRALKENANRPLKMQDIDKDKVIGESLNYTQAFMNAMNESFKAKGSNNRRACRESVKQSLQELKIHDSRFINKTPGQAYKLIEATLNSNSRSIESGKKKKLTEAAEQPYFKAFITNLGKYNEGDLVGKWVEFPIDEDEFQDVLNSIDIDANYEEWFVTDYDCNLNGFEYSELGEYPSYESLQEFGNLVSSITDIEAVNNVYEATNDLREAIEGLEDDTILYHSGIDTEEDLGIYVAEELYGGIENIPSDIIEACFDYSGLGRDLSFGDYWDMLDEDQQEALLAEGHEDYYTAAEYFCNDENASDQKVGETYVDMLGGLSSVSDPEQYFDFEAFGKYITDRSAFVFTSDGCVEFLR